MRLNDCARDRQTHTHTVRLGGKEGIENVREFVNGNAAARIAHSDLFYEYRTNVDSYPKWQAWMRQTQPRLLVIWGKYELSFDPSEPEAYRRDVPNAEIHIVDGGHFALDTAADAIAQHVRAFLNKP